jgi:hypothetical protein
MSKSWPLLVFVSLKYCAEKRLLKTLVAFFMNVTVFWYGDFDIEQSSINLYMKFWDSQVIQGRLEDHLETTNMFVYYFTDRTVSWYIRKSFVLSHMFYWRE